MKMKKNEIYFSKILKSKVKVIIIRKMDRGISLFKIGKNNYSCIVRENSQYYEVEIRGNERSRNSMINIFANIIFDGNKYPYNISVDDNMLEQKEKLIEDFQVIYLGDFIEKNDVGISFLSSSPTEYISVNECNIKPAK